ncbi:MAG TPA: hypothetical protein VGB50_01390 [Flavobacterium sp.]|jgi:regulatory protein YycH of two-component signal transduction system YycFG
MKNILLLLLSFSALFASAQVKAPETDFILQNKVVFWQHTYDIAEKSSSEISSMVKERMASVTADTVVATNQAQFTLPVKRDKVNFKKYGGTSFNTIAFAQLYMDYSVVIDVSDNKYRVTIRQIKLDNRDATEKKAGDLSTFVCNTSNISFRTDEGTRKGMQYMHKHFLEKFDITAAIPVNTNSK